MSKTNNTSIYTEVTPNPLSMKFVLNRKLFPGQAMDFQNESEASSSPLVSELFGFPFIKSIFISENFITISKIGEDIKWADMIPSVKKFLIDYFEGVDPVIFIDSTTAKITETKSQSVSSDFEQDAEIIAKIKSVLKEYIKPAVEMDGGAIQFKQYHDGIVTLVFQGSCKGCPSSVRTLKSGVEGMMKRMIPEVKSVEADSLMA